jgi:plasmid replication DNA-binding protein KfrA
LDRHQDDELKLWKEEKTQADALGAELPPVVADTMRSLWVVAVEHGERAFEKRRAELEAQLATAREQLATAAAACEQIHASNDLMKQQIAALGQQLTELREQLATELRAKNEAVSQSHALQQEVTAVRLESARQLDSLTHVDMHRIWFTPETAAKLDDIVVALRKSWNLSAFGQHHSNPDERTLEMVDKAYKLVTEKVPELRAAVELEFRGLLAVELRPTHV